MYVRITGCMLSYLVQDRCTFRVVRGLPPCKDQDTIVIFFYASVRSYDADWVLESVKTRNLKDYRLITGYAQFCSCLAYFIRREVPVLVTEWIYGWCNNEFIDGERL